MRVLRACLALCAAAPALGFLAAPLASPHALAHQRASVLPSASPRAATRPVAGALRMGGANVPRVPYKDPGSDQWQVRDTPPPTAPPQRLPRPQLTRNTQFHHTQPAPFFQIRHGCTRTTKIYLG
jgi:hypothetical protein